MIMFRPSSSSGVVAMLAVCMSSSLSSSSLFASGQSVGQILDLIYESTDGSRWRNSTGWDMRTNTNSYWYCDYEWTGITCYDVEEGDELYGHIQTLDLSDNALVGKLPSHVFAIPYISEIVVRNNPDLRVAFDDIEKATSLKRLVLSNTDIESFAGIDNANDALEELHMTSCGYQSTFPMELTNLTKLKSLFANYNAFHGTLPDEISNMKGLQELYLFQNNFEGTIPSTIGQLTDLQVLILSNNNFSGDIPSESLNQLTNLQILALADNNLKGGLPSFEKLDTLYEVYLQNNNLAGMIPFEFLWNAPKHDEITVDLSNNQLSGKFWAYRLKEFDSVTFYLYGNKFTEIDEHLCDNDNWMNGYVFDYGCDAIMCPAGFYASGGRAEDDYCQPCDSDTLGLKYMGSVDCGNEQNTILKGLYNALGGVNWQENNWEDEPDECKWDGIGCNENGDVDVIELNHFGLYGTPPSQIFALPELRILDLSENFIQFEFDGIEMAQNLEVLDLFSTGLKSIDNIDQLASTSINTLVLSSNDINEELPDVLWSLYGLQELAISHNNFYGTLSPGIGNLQNLTTFHAYGNQLTGEIPWRISYLDDCLEDLVLSENDFTGAIPSEMSQMRKLETFSMHQITSTRGGLTGNLPDFANCTMLSTIHLSGNSIAGELPEDFLLGTELDNSKYIEVDLSSNYLSGQIPRSWQRLPYLNLDVSNNRIDHVPSALCQMDHWQNNLLGQNDYDCNYILCDTYTYNAQGRATDTSSCIPCDSAEYLGATFCFDENTDNLQILEALYASTNGGNWLTKDNWFSTNNICDPVDGWFGIFCDPDGVDIVKIDLSGNGLTGTPSTDIFKLPHLRELDLEDNAIDFSFDGIESASRLNTLYLSETSISSLDGIGKAVSLKNLHLTGCYLSGPIPNELFHLVNLEGLFLNYNRFSGRVSKTIEQLTNLEELYLMSNDLSGPIPAAIGKLSKLRILSLSDNAFTGSIPTELNNLISLEILAIEHERKLLANSMSGNRRRTQQSYGLTGPLPAFDQLPNLQKVLLGYNSITGTIPYNFVTGIEDKTLPLRIDLEYNFLGGIIPSSLTQFMNVDASFSGNKFLGIAPGLCSMTDWNNGDVLSDKCDAIVCPINTYSPIGRKSAAIDCTPCPDFTTSQYLGSVECISENDQAAANERDILKKLYDDLQGSGWYSQQHWYDDSVNFCDWYGITCAPGGVDSVESIRLNNNGLVGHVPSVLFELPNLKELNIGHNRISISFTNIEKSPKLQLLNVDNTGLTTLMGIENSLSLKMLHAVSNVFTHFPAEVMQMTKLEVLYLSSNKFDINIPDLSGLSQLAFFECNNCSLRGNIPTWVDTLTNLQYLSLSSNILTGSVASGFNNLLSLKHLDLSDQSLRGGGLTGNLPTFSAMENLSELYLSRNKFSGEIDESFLANVNSLSVTVDLRYNEISGAIPDILYDRFDDFTLLLAENKIDSIPDFCDDDSFSLNWNDGDVTYFGCDAILCRPGHYSPIGRKTYGNVYNCERCDDSNDSETQAFYGSTTCGTLPDKVALEAIYTSLGGPDWLNNEFWMENDLYCDWYGVICDDDHERVIGLDFSENGLVGVLPAELFDLTELTQINLKKNKIQLSLSGIERLTELETLNLSEIDLTSVEGLNKAVNLRVLHLTGNDLASIPQDIYELPNIEEIYMNYNKMEGQISSKIGQLTALRELFMFRNKLTGNLPSELGQLKQLRTLGLGENFFSGDLPKELNDLPKIEIIALQHARINTSGPGGHLTLDRGDEVGLTGDIPAFDNCPRLTELYLSYNDLEGLIPTNFLDSVDGNQDVIVDLTMNHVKGALPTSLQKFNYLTIYIAGNEITYIDESFCDLDTWMGGEVAKFDCDAILCPSGTYNEFGRQNNAGPICQPCVFTFSAPFYGNGECTPDLKNYNEKEILRKLYDATGGSSWLDADNWNDDSVSVCDWHGVHCLSEDIVGAASVVKEISLPSNKLTGTVPPQIFDLQFLEVLNIRDNMVAIQMEGIVNEVHLLKSIYMDNTLISSLNGIGKLKNLRTLHLQQNNFVGQPLSEEVFSLTKLKHLYISDANFGGQLSSSISNLKNLEDFYCHKNEMTGEIPSEIGALENLVTLVLSENRFVGTIPDLSNMLSLQSLLIDSFTRRSAGLSGPLPTFDHMPSLREIFLNENSLTGQISEDFLGGVTSTNEKIKVGLKGNRIEGSIPHTLKHFQKLDIDLADNLITSIDPALCQKDFWMSGYVEIYGCDAILCPPGFFNQFGRQDNPLLQCKQCAGTEQSPHLGATQCKSETKKREREILETFYKQCGGDNWKNKVNWLDEDTDICHWYGIQCNDQGSVDSILLGSNNIVGKVPRELFGLQTLKWLWLYSNPVDFSFHGIGEASSLTSLLLDSTGLTSLDGIGDAYQLKDLQVRFNKLTGTIPDAIQHLNNLETLSMSDNQFTGAVPNFSRLHSIKSLRISNNRLNDHLPSFSSNNKLHTVDLSNNNIYGTIPSNFLASVDTNENVLIDLSKNQIEGNVPEELNRFDKMTLYLRDNFITGVDSDLCEKTTWNDGDVGKFQCDALLCPPGTYSPNRGRESQGSPCITCDKAQFYGQSQCVLLNPNSASSHIKLRMVMTMTLSIVTFTLMVLY